MRELKFRFWDCNLRDMITDDYPLAITSKGFIYDLSVNRDKPYVSQLAPQNANLVPMQFTGLKDKNEKEYYIGDIGEFDNGDKFVLRMEDWLEVYVDWIGEPECEDQARDLYRISSAKIIGNIYQDSGLLNRKSEV